MSIPTFLIEMLNKQYGEEKANQILNGYQKERTVSIRVNTLKSDINRVLDELSKEGIEYEKVPWYKDAVVIKNVKENLIQSLEIYKNGEIYLQSLSSMLPPLILDPKPNTDILDMCSAPGGKTTQMAALSENEAHITACEINHIRTERLRYNIEKTGSKLYLYNAKRFSLYR